MSDSDKKKPRSRKKAGYGKKGRPVKEEIKNMLKARKIVEHNNVDEAYQELHPNSSKESSRKNSSRWVNEDVKEYVKNLISEDEVFKVSEKNIVKLYQKLFLMAMTKGSIRDGKGVLDSISKLVLGFKEKVENTNYEGKSDSEIDNEFNDLLRQINDVENKEE